MNELATHRTPDIVSETIHQLLKLSSSDRIEIAMALWESLSDAEREAEIVLTDEQKAELDRRWAEHQADPSSGIPWEVVKQRHERMR
ncbi:MAG: addiction module protein [Chloroflexota bacterium]